MTCTKLYFDEFGANTTPGVTDMTATFQAAAAAAADGTEIRGIPGTTYKITGTTDITADNVTIDLGNSTIDASELPDTTEVNRPDGIFDILGSASAITTLAANTAINDDTVTVTDATGISIGDALHFLSSERWYQEGDSTVGRTTINRVMDISGNVLTLQHAMNQPFDISSSSVTVTAWAGVQNFKLTGGHYVGPGYEGAHENGVGPCVLYSLYTQNLNIQDIRSTVGFQGAWLWTQKNYNGLIANNTGRGLPDSYTDALVEGDNKGFTGIIVTDSMGVRVTGNTGYRLRHLVDGSRSRDVLVDGNFAYDCHRAPFGSHLGTVDWTFDNNFARSRIPGGSGMLWRGHSVKVTNNDFSGVIGSGSYGFYDTVGHQDDDPKTYLISGNTFASSRNAIGLYSNIGKATLANNTVTGGFELAAYSPIDIASMDIGSVHITGGTATCAIGGVGINIEDNSPRSRNFIKIDNVKIVGFASYGVDSNANSAADTTLIVEDCEMVPTGTPAGYVRAADTYDLLSLKPNYYDGTELNIGDDFGNTGSTLVLSDGTTDVTPQTTRLIHWSYRDGIFSAVFSVRMTSKGALSGALRLTGWPKNPSAGIGGGQVAFSSGLNVTAGQTITLDPISGSDRVDLYLNDGTGGVSALQASEITDTFRIQGTISYPA